MTQKSLALAYKDRKQSKQKPTTSSNKIGSLSSHTLTELAPNGKLSLSCTTSEAAFCSQNHPQPLSVNCD